MGCFDLAHSQHLQARLVPAPLAILAQHPPWGGWDMAAKASLDVPLCTWGRVRPGRAPACSRKPPAHSAALGATREPKPAGSALAPQWDRVVPALGLVSWSLPVFLLHSLKTKLILASGSLSFIPDCCSPQPSPCIFSVCWKALFAHVQHQCIFPFGNRESSTQHQALYSPKHRICCFLWVPMACVSHLQAAGAGS